MEVDLGIYGHDHEGLFDDYLDEGLPSRWVLACSLACSMHSAGIYRLVLSVLILLVK